MNKNLKSKHYEYQLFTFFGKCISNFENVLKWSLPLLGITCLEQVSSPNLANTSPAVILGKAVQYIEPSYQSKVKVIAEEWLKSLSNHIFSQIVFHT